MQFMTKIYSLFGFLNFFFFRILEHHRNVYVTIQKCGLIFEFVSAVQETDHLNVLAAAQLVFAKSKSAGYQNKEKKAISSGKVDHLRYSLVAGTEKSPRLKNLAFSLPSGS